MQALKHELKKVGSLALFFFLGFGYILLIMKLFLEEYSIDAYVLSKAIIGALIAAKAVAIMDISPWMNRFQDRPLYVGVLYKTFLYTLAVMILGIIENLFEAYRKTKSLNLALMDFRETHHFSTFMATILCIGIVFLIHNIFKEIDSYLGKGQLIRLFFK